MGKATKYKHKTALSVLYFLWWTVWLWWPLDALKQLFCNPHRAAAFNCLQKTTKKHKICWSHSPSKLDSPSGWEPANIYSSAFYHHYKAKSPILCKSHFFLYVILVSILSVNPPEMRKIHLLHSLLALLFFPQKITIIKICTHRVLPFIMWQIAAKPRNTLSPLTSHCHCPLVNMLSGHKRIGFSRTQGFLQGAANTGLSGWRSITY